MAFQNNSVGTSACSKLLTGSFILEGKLHNEISLGCQDAFHVFEFVRVESRCSMRWVQYDKFGVYAESSWGSFRRILLGKLSSKSLREIKDIDHGQFEDALLVTSGKTKSFFVSICKNLGLDFPSSEWNDFVLKKLLFTILGFAIVRDQYWVFGLGDGCFGINNDIRFIDNSPTPYFNQLLFEKDDVQNLKVVIHASGKTENLKYLWVASDGLYDVLSSSAGKEEFSNFLGDEFTCGRNTKGEDTTIQAFRRTVYKHNLNRFSDDVALALVKTDTSGVLKLGNTEGEKDE